MKRLICALLLASAAFAQASLFVTPWTPIFQGIDLALGTNLPATTVTNNGVVFTDSNLQIVRCAKVDLSNPGVQLFTTPRASNYLSESRETLSLGISNFIRRYGVQVASDANFLYLISGWD